VRALVSVVSAQQECVVGAAMRGVAVQNASQTDNGAAAP